MKLEQGELKLYEVSRGLSFQGTRLKSTHLLAYSTFGGQMNLSLRGWAVPMVSATADQGLRCGSNFCGHPGTGPFMLV